MLVAVTVIEPAVAGATNVAVVAACALKVPPVVVHVTPCPPTSFVTVAVKFSDCAVTRPPRVGVRATDMGLPLAAVIVMVAEAVLVESATDVAVNVTLAGFGTAAGAV